MCDGMRAPMREHGKVYRRRFRCALTGPVLPALHWTVPKYSPAIRKYLEGQMKR